MRHLPSTLSTFPSTSSVFGDFRLDRRLITITKHLTRNPGLSLPKALPNHAALEGAYRFLNNPAVTPTRILMPHYKKTAAAARQSELCVVAHDTTTLSFDGDSRDGFGPLVDGGLGLFAHVSLAIDGHSRAVHGVLDLRTHVRGENAERNESARWPAAVESVEKRIAAPAHAIHVMDREADSYSLLATMIAGGHRFVIRGKHDRTLIDDAKMSAALLKADCLLEREAKLTNRKGSELPATRRAHPPRKSRVAKLAIAAQTVTMRRPRSAGAELPETLTLNVVQAIEVETPSGQRPVEWTLLTTEPIETAANAAQIVDVYRCRWIIEEYFKALKTGLAIEKRQLESREGIENMLAVSMPIAAQLLALRTLARTSSDQPARALSAIQRRILRVLVKERRHTLAANPTAREEMLAVAAVGGHIKWSGDPGWAVLGRGYADIVQAEALWRAMRGEM